MADPAVLRELPSLRQLGLRGDLADLEFAAAATATLGFPLPDAPDAARRHADLTALWLGPNEWLVVGGARALADHLRDALAGIHSAVVDLSASRVVFELAGPAAREVL